LGRELRHVPFSRKTSTSQDTTTAYRDIHESIQQSSGVILALPEHLLSFKLSGLQRLLDARVSEATEMIKVQTWLTRESRDILDECDYTLAVKTQLIYPSDPQKTVDGHPNRWETVQDLLRLVKSHLRILEQTFPHSIEVIWRSQGGFPIVYFLRQDVEDALLSQLVEDICSGRSAILPGKWDTLDSSAIKKFISEKKILNETAAQIPQIFPDRPTAKNVVYLLRGLLVHRILLTTLKKRWNVQYGLHPGRDPLAVPYTAKGTPSELSEWGHPDVAILLTCLAFYYEGLTIPQFRQSLEHVAKCDESSQVYERFSQQSHLPSPLREWKSINVDDEIQLNELWHHLRYNIVVLDYFVNNFVFPRYAKQFESKLQTSGWDIPLSPLSLAGGDTNTAKIQATHCLTTGFSGTNDWKRMLPLTMTQQDLPGLLHTNAEVLTYFLQPRNRQYVLAADPSGRRLSEVGLLQEISNRNIRVLVDAGAQILEMDNLSLVKAWLVIFNQGRRAATAAVYFNRDSKPMVLYEQGHQVALLSSPFAEDLSQCLVYIDEAHTRGTDLKMPHNARGALTLGLGQTKDHTVQG
jgi:hypothetical protein